MITMQRQQLGVTLIEMMIGLAILAALLSLAVPAFQVTIQNAQIRTAAESVVSGLQLARSEAVRRNRQVQLTFSGTSNGAALTGGMDWTIQADDLNGTAPSFTLPVQARNGTDGSPNARMGTKTATAFGTPAAAGSGLPATIVFSGLGRLTAATTVRQIDITHANVPTARRLSIILMPGGDFRLCDPALSLSANLQGCA